MDIQSRRKIEGTGKVNGIAHIERLGNLSGSALGFLFDCDRLLFRCGFFLRAFH